MTFDVDIPVLLALFALIFQGTSDFWVKSAVVRRGDPFSVMAMTCPTFILTSALSGVVLRALQFSPSTLWFGLLVGFLAFSSMNLFATSLIEGEASVNTTLFRLNFVVTSLLSIGLLGESAGWLKWMGLLFAAGAVCSVALAGGSGKEGPGKTTSLAIGALVIYGFNGFVMKVATSVGVKAPVLSVVASSTFLVLSVIAHLSPLPAFRFQVSPAVIRYGLLAGFLQALAFNSILWAMGLGGEASVVIPILQLSFVWTAALAVLSLKESVDARKGLGFVLAVSALVVLAL
ncbi:MAG: EamA family transporter [Nitrospinota bacterium]